MCKLAAGQKTLNAQEISTRLYNVAKHTYYHCVCHLYIKNVMQYGMGLNWGKSVFLPAQWM